MDMFTEWKQEDIIPRINKEKNKKSTMIKLHRKRVKNNGSQALEIGMKIETMEVKDDQALCNIKQCLEKI